MLVNTLLVGAGGFVGAAARYLLSVALLRLPGGLHVPYGTIAANLVGCLAIGVLGGMAETRDLLSPEVRIFLVTGALGGFTTFSAFGYESIRLLGGDTPWLGAANVVGQVVLGLGAVVLGMWAVRVV